jgi:hypothetical protein
MTNVFILTLPNTNQEWLRICVNSLANEPVTISILDGVEGNIGKGRRAGFALGNAPYVAYVDPDDWVHPGAFAACTAALDANPQAVVAYTREAEVDPDGLLISNRQRSFYEPYIGTSYEPFRSHHLSVYRRAALPDLSFLDDYPILPEYALKERLYYPGSFLYVDVLGYCWRRHPMQMTKKAFEAPSCVLELKDRMVEAVCRTRK